MPSYLVELEHELASSLRKVDEQCERIKRLEDIIKRASWAFYCEGSDKETAVSMLTILEESR